MGVISSLTIAFALIAIIALSVYLILKSINDETCRVVLAIPYSTILRNFNGTTFTSDVGRYSAEIIVKSKIEDSLDKLRSEKSMLTEKDKPKIDKLTESIDFIKNVDSNMHRMRDDVIYYMMTTTIIEDKPRFINMLNNRNYLSVIADFNSNTHKFNKKLNTAKRFIANYNSLVDTNSLSDEDIYKIVMYG